MSKIIENKLIEKFKNRESFTREELFDFFRYFEPYLKKGTFGWRIYDLKNKNIIKPIKRGLYTISYKPKYKPLISSDLLKLGENISKKFKEIKYCILDTGWLNDFSQHQSSKSIIIIEIEKEFVESLFYYLKDNFRYEFYLNPNEKVIDFYISESSNPVIIKKLITRSPIVKTIQNRIKITIPFLEKILIDLYADEKLFYYYQGSELRHIYKNAISNYSINFTKLLSYARRREKESEIKSYLIKNMGDVLKDIIND